MQDLGGTPNFPTSLRQDLAFGFFSDLERAEISFIFGNIVLKRRQNSFHVPNAENHPGRDCVCLPGSIIFDSLADICQNAT